MNVSKKSTSLFALAGFGAAVAAAGWFAARHSPRDARTKLWYSRLDKPAYTPPQFVFPIVWTTLYSLIAISGWRVWREESSSERSRALALWAGQLASNAGWTKLFFGEHRPVKALLDVGLVETAVVKYIRTAAQVDRGAALCFVPYAAWLAFAAVLTADIARRNPDARKKFPHPRAA